MATRTTHLSLDRVLAPEGPQETVDGDFPIHPVAPIQDVLSALGDPVRLEMVRRMMTSGVPMACVQLYDGVGKSTASHHFKILREAGLTERHTIGGTAHQLLRRTAVEETYPGVVSSIVSAAESSRG